MAVLNSRMSNKTVHLLPAPCFVCMSRACVNFISATDRYQFYAFNPRKYKQSHTPTAVQGRGAVAGTSSCDFAVLQYFETFLP